MANAGHRSAECKFDRAFRAFIHQHRDDLSRGTVAEQLAQRLFVIGNGMALDQIDKMLRRIIAERRSCEMGVCGQIALRRMGAGGVDVGEIAPSAAGNEDFFARLVGMIDHQHMATALPGGCRAHQPGTAGAQYYRVKFPLHSSALPCHNAPMKRFLPALALFALASPSAANDSSAAIGLGGLELRQNDAISMDSEDLFLSLDEVRIKYRFTNHSNQDVETLVSFPLPAIPDGIQGYLGDTSYPEWSERDFHTSIDGKEVALDYSEIFTVNGKNVEPRLKQLGWPLKFWNDYDFLEKVDQFSEAEKAKYLAEGLLKKPEPKESPDWIVPGWQMQTFVNRVQRFPAGKTVTVDHRYKPIAGGSVGGMLGTIASPGKADKELREWANEYRAQYCIDDMFLAGFRKKMAAKRKEGERNGTEMGMFYVENWLDYVLKSGANWRGPIKDFRMVIDKRNADNLISLCADGVQKIGPTRFEIRKTNFEPTRDISILIVEWPESE